jgi:hypothetical protein
LNRLSAISSVAGAGATLSYAYSYNNANQRVLVPRINPG